MYHKNKTGTQDITCPRSHGWEVTGEPECRCQCQILPSTKARHSSVRSPEDAAGELPLRGLVVTPGPCPPSDPARASQEAVETGGLHL